MTEFHLKFTVEDINMFMKSYVISDSLTEMFLAPLLYLFRSYYIVTTKCFSILWVLLHHNYIGAQDCEKAILILSAAGLTPSIQRL